MDNLSLIKKLPPMLSGSTLEEALSILPEYDPEIVTQDAATRLIALSDLYKVFVPNQMSREIYSKLYLALLRSLQKKDGILKVKQSLENHKAILQQEYSGILGGSDSFTILGAACNSPLHLHALSCQAIDHIRCHVQRHESHGRHLRMGDHVPTVSGLSRTMVFLFYPGYFSDYPNRHIGTFQRMSGTVLHS